MGRGNPAAALDWAAARFESDSRRRFNAERESAEAPACRRDCSTGTSDSAGGALCRQRKAASQFPPLAVDSCVADCGRADEKVRLAENAGTLSGCLKRH